MSPVFADLGMVPMCQTYIAQDELFDAETFYPLRVTACMNCHYVGLPEYVSPEEIFGEYACFSSTSTSWSEYIRNSVDELIDLFALSPENQVVEMARNDGYLLQHFVSKGFSPLGVEPARNVAKVANERGVPNYCGIRGDLIDYLVDRSSYKCGKFAPGSRLPIREVEQVRLTKPDFLLILPWNIRDEIIEQMSFIREWGGRFIVPIPHLETL